MRRRRIVNLVQGIGSLSLLAAIAIGPPVALVRAVGSPLPEAIPSLEAIDRASRTGISDEIIVNALAVLLWLAWAQIAIALIIEIAAVIRRRPALHVPVLPGLQLSIARLVAGVVMMVTTTQPATTASAPLPIAVMSPAVAETIFAEPAAVSSAVPASIASPSPTGAPSASSPTVTVERHDSFWAIAERTLGDGLRWREIRDMNVGRTMLDGHVLAADSDLLRPGWVLLLPGNARTDSPQPAESAPSAGTSIGTAGEVAVEAGDSLWAIAEQQAAIELGRPPDDGEVRPYWQNLITVNRERLVEPDDPNIIYAGQILSLPAGHGQALERSAPESAPPAELPPQDSQSLPDPQVTSPPPPSPGPLIPREQTEPTMPTTERDVRHPPDNSADVSADDGPLPTPLAIALGGLASTALAVGAKRALDRRRRRFAVDNPGRVPPPTPPNERPLHREIVANADGEAIDGLRSTMGRLAEDLAEIGAVCRPRIVQHDADHLDVLLDQPTVDPPAGWTVTGGGALWSLTTDTRPSSDTCAAPLLVTLGQPDDGGQLYLDLEADGLIALNGDPDTARSLARSIITELALSPLADTVRIIAVGDLIDPRSSTLEHVALADTWEEIEEDVTAWAEQSHGALVENGWPNSFEL